MGKAEERSWIHCARLCEENLIWFEGMLVVVGEELTSTGILCLLYIIKLKCKVLIDILHE